MYVGPVGHYDTAQTTSSHGRPTSMVSYLVQYPLTSSSYNF